MQSSPEVWKDFFETYYRDELNKAAEKSISLNGSTPINVNFLKDLVIFKEGIVAEELLDSPDIVLDHANHGIANSENIHNVELENSCARVYNLPISRRVLIRDLRSEHISKLVSIDGVVRKVTEVRPRVIEAAFLCSSCAVKMFIHQEDSTIKYPYECKSCGSRKFLFLPEESRSIDSQRMRIQEYPENLRGGEQPQTLDVVLENDLTGIINPGDRVVINGIVRATPRSVSGKRLRHMDITLEGNSIEVLQQEYEEFEITEEDKKKILEIGNDPEIFENIVKSIAPVIYGYDDMKMAVALQLFGGIPKKLPDGTEIRGDVHVLLVGDPGVAKSQLLRYVHRIAPRSVYTTGKGTTSAGLTATATKDEYDGRWTLEAGALVLADKGIALVDEIDKMRSEDRGGLHEAMEQQSYHPSFEITLADGSKHKIGQLVDDLFDEYPERRVDGIDCEILDANGLGIELLSTDFKEAFKIKADRVSRHKAPDHFVKIKYSNGREVTVTPEHPVYVFRDGEIVTEEASQINEGEFAPSVKNMEFSGNIDLQTDVSIGRKAVDIPPKMNQELASFLGYFTTEGYSYAGSAMEVGLSNTNEEIISDMSGVTCSSFGVEPINYTSVNRTLRVVSKPVYEFMSVNFPQLMEKSKEKRLPPQIFYADFEDRVSFLRSAFAADGSTETEALCYRTSSKGLAEDYQDLLLTLGIYSRIVLDKSSTSYKVYITRCSLQRFVEIVLGESGEKLDYLLKRSDKNLRKHDILPPYSGEIIRECLGELGLKYDGYFHQHITRNYGITREVISRYIKIIEERIKELEGNPGDSFKEFREFLNYSQEKTAELIGATRSIVDYMERGGYSSEKQAILFEKLKNGSEEVIRNVKEKLNKIRELEELRWLKIKEIEYIPNEGKYRTDWVYDVTVEPTHNFISHGIILHNTVSVAKAGINAVLWARCAMLGAANPKYGRFDRYAPIAEQIDLSPTLLSRFDLIFVMTDDPDENRDRALAKHILDSHELGEKLEKLKNIVSTEYDQNAIMSEAKKIEPAIDPELLRKYIAYSKRTVFPVLTKEVKQTIEDFYSSLRSQAKENTPMPVTARQLEALIRLAEASARLQLKDKVTIEDVNRVIGIVRKSLEQIAVDPETGEMDIDYAFSGTSKTQRDRIMVIKKIVEEVAATHERGAPEEEILNSAEDQGISWNKAKDILQKMRMNGEVYCPKPGYFDITHNY